MEVDLTEDEDANGALEWTSMVAELAQVFMHGVLICAGFAKAVSSSPDSCASSPSHTMQEHLPYLKQ